MKQFTLAFIALATFTGSYAQTNFVEFTDTQNNAINNAAQAACTTEFITPATTNANGPLETMEFADNFIVPGGTFFSIEDGVIGLIASLNQDVTTVFPDITFRIYGENTTDPSVPGVLIGEESTTNVVVTNTGNLNAALDGYEVVFTLDNPILIENTGGDATYWFSVFVPNSQAAQTFVETGVQNTSDTLVLTFRDGTDNTASWSLVGNSSLNLSYSLNGDCEALSVNTNEIIENISLYPNPTNGDLTISLAGNLSNVNINIVNVNGQVVMSTTTTATTLTTVPTNRLASGMYFAQISSEEGSATLKFIKN